MVVLTNEALPYKEAKLLKKCFACAEYKWRGEFEHMYARRCLACLERMQHARCKHCGEFPGMDQRHKPRTYCEAPACQVERRRDVVMRSATKRHARAMKAKKHLCQPCGRSLPKTPEFFQVMRRDPLTGVPTKLSAWCKECKNALRREKYASDPSVREKTRLHDHARRARERERRALDPAYAAEARRRRAEESRRRYWREQEQAKQPPQPVEAEASMLSGPEVPAKPLMDAISAWVVREDIDLETAAERIGTSVRRFSDWRTRRSSTRLSLADKVLIAIGLNWYEVWDEVEYPKVAKIWGA